MFLPGFLIDKLKSKLLPGEGPVSRNESGLEIPVLEGNVCKERILESPSENRIGLNKVVHTKSGETNSGNSQDVRMKANLSTPSLLISTTYDQNQIERLDLDVSSHKCETISPNCESQQSSGNQKDKSTSILPSEINERQTIEMKPSQKNIRVGNMNIQSTSIEKAKGQPLVKSDVTPKFMNPSPRSNFGADLHRSKKSSDLTKPVESLISESELDFGADLQRSKKSSDLTKKVASLFLESELDFGADLHRSKKSSNLTKAEGSLISESELDRVSNHNSKQRDNHHKRSDRFSTQMSRNITLNKTEVSGQSVNDKLFPMPVNNNKGTSISHACKCKNPTQSATPLRPNIKHSVSKIQPAEEKVSIETSSNENENKYTEVSTSYKDLQWMLLSSRLAAEKQSLKDKGRQKAIHQPPSPSSLMMLGLMKQPRKEQRMQKAKKN